MSDWTLIVCGVFLFIGVASSIMFILTLTIPNNRYVRAINTFVWGDTGNTRST